MIFSVIVLPLMLVMIPVAFWGEVLVPQSNLNREDPEGMALGKVIVTFTVEPGARPAIEKFHQPKAATYPLGVPAEGPVTGEATIVPELVARVESPPGELMVAAVVVEDTVEVAEDAVEDAPEDTVEVVCAAGAPPPMPALIDDEAVLVTVEVKELTEVEVEVTVVVEVLVSVLTLVVVRVLVAVEVTVLVGP